MIELVVYFLWLLLHAIGIGATLIGIALLIDGVRYLLSDDSG